jgi:hypothetical protein
MGRDHIPSGRTSYGRRSPGRLEWPMTRADNGASVWVEHKRPLHPGSSVILMDDSDTGETYRAVEGKLGYVEPYEEC